MLAPCFVLHLSDKIEWHQQYNYQERVMIMVFTQAELHTWQEKHPLLKNILNLEPVFWQNPNIRRTKNLHSQSLTKEDMYEANALWERFSPFLSHAFPETREAGGIIESPLKKIPHMKAALHDTYATSITGDLYLKCDHDLAVAGSIKARGGFYEVLHYAESLAQEAGLITKTDDYAMFADPSFRALFKNHSIGVGSTGNLGLSIGIMSAKLGFSVSVYVSADAKEWKKTLLREKGVRVHEFAGDFSVAIRTGRKKTLADPNGYFIDDEDSDLLFLGYSTAALRLKEQLEEKGVKVDKDHPLMMYLPCGVGGSPGGIMFGMKQIFGDDVHCFFVEPTHSPAVLLGLLTGRMEKISVQDFGLDNRTEADGLAVGRPSSFATEISDQLVSGIYTIADDDLFQLLAMLVDHEEIYVEPSATAGLLGPGKVTNSNYMKEKHIDPKKVTHIVWSTGGALVPEGDMEKFYNRGK